MPNKITKIECLGQTEHYSLDDTQINDFKYYFDTCIKGISHSINIIQALLMRLIFSLHSLIAIGYVYLVKQDEWYLVNIIGVVFLFIELFVTIIQRKGKEPNSWFFPCFFIYIGTMIPPIWFVELTRIQQANSRRHLFSNESTYDLVENIVQTFGADQLQISAKNIAVDQIAVGLELSLLLLIIMGRWFLPKAESLSRTALSQLLLVYMSLASDMVDLLSLLNEVQVQESSVMHFFTLSIFSWGLFQFSLNLIINKDENNNLDNLDSSLNSSLYDNTKEDNNNTTLSEYFMSCFNFSNEIWSILISLIFQDGPFLALRLTAVFRFNVRTFTTMFFTCKNGIILFIQCYRLFAICTEKKQENIKKYDIDLKVNNRENIIL